MARIRRGPMAADRFVQVANSVVRNASLSRRARGLFAELASHVDGWSTSAEKLAELGPEGRDAIRAALAELESADLLARIRERRADGTLGEMVFVVTDQPGALADLVIDSADEPQTPRSEPVSGNPSMGVTSVDELDEVATSSDNSPQSDDYESPVTGNPTLADPTLVNPPPKNTNNQEHQDQEHEDPARSAASDAVTAREDAEAEASPPAPDLEPTPPPATPTIDREVPAPGQRGSASHGWTPERNDQVDQVIQAYGLTDPDDGGVDLTDLTDGQLAALRSRIAVYLAQGETGADLTRRITSRATNTRGPAPDPLARAMSMIRPPRPVSVPPQ